MHSIALLEQLEALPGGSDEKLSLQWIMEKLQGVDACLNSVDVAVTTSAITFCLFHVTNVDDGLAQAYAAAFPGYGGSVHTHWQEIIRRGPESVTGFVSALKGKVAEVRFADRLQSDGYTNVEIALSPTQEVWDITAIAPSGEAVEWQVKTGGANYASAVEDAMTIDPEVHFAVSSEIFNVISARSPGRIDQMTDLGPDSALTGNVREGLEQLSDSYGIDLPDGIGNAVPYISSLWIGWRVIHMAKKTENEYKASDRDSKNRVHVVRTLTLISQFGFAAVCSFLGASAGSVIPGPGTLVGGGVGAIGGVVVGNRLRPRVRRRCLEMVGLTIEDLFYFRNKVVIDHLALSFRREADSTALLRST